MHARANHMGSIRGLRAQTHVNIYSIWPLQSTGQELLLDMDVEPTLLLIDLYVCDKYYADMREERRQPGGMFLHTCIIYTSRKQTTHT
jgi:hypothetical protein